MRSVYRKEMKSYSISMIGYVFIAFILLVIGLYYSYLNLNLASPKFETVLKNVQFIFLVFVPILTMRVLAEEKKQKTDQLLLTLPLNIRDIVIGKYLGLATMFAIPMAFVCLYPLAISFFGTVNLPVAYFSILGFFLLGCANMAIGVFFSGLTENPVIAAVSTFGALLLCSLMDTIGNMIPSTAVGSLASFSVLIVLLCLVVYNMIHDVIFTCLAGGILEAVLVFLYLTKASLLAGSIQKLLSLFYLNGRLENFYNGILDVPAILYYVTVIILFLFLSMQTLEKRRWSSKRLKNGAYSIAATVILVIVLLLVNLIYSRLPVQYRQFDISSSKLYTLTDTSKEYLDSLEADVELYYICEGGEEDTTIERLLERYEAASGHITLEQIDPAVYPAFTSKYTDESVSNNSVIVVSGEVSRVVDEADMYVSEFNYSTYSYTNTRFDGEGMITGAIDYVTSDNVPKLYILSANGESAVSETYADMISKNNVDAVNLNLLTEEAVPDDAAAILINCPSTDYSDEVTKKITDYLESGGKAIIYSDYDMTEFPNFDSILSNYGVQRRDGIILEGDSGHYMSYQYCLIPEVQYSDATDNVYDGSYLLAPMAQSIENTETYRNSLTFTPLLETSSASYAKEDVMNMTTAEKESGDVSGPFDIGMLIQEDINNDDAEETEIIYYSTGYLLDDDYNTSVSGKNAELFGNAVSYLCNQDRAGAAVAVKSLQTQVLSITDFSANLLTVICVFALPALFVIYGGLVWYSRRQK